MIACFDPFHVKGKPEKYGERYEIPYGRMIAVGFRCRTCGVQTMTVSELVTEPRPCPKCGEIFDADVEVDGDLCGTCWVESMLAVHERRVRYAERRPHLRRLHAAYRRKSA
jgi:hypothetical protein